MFKVDSLGSRRFIEAGFPCHQVGAETQRERGASSSLPPLYYLHVWWARRPLTPSRAAILASLLPADTDPDWFLRQLGIEKVQALVNGEPWTLTGKILERILKDSSGREWIEVDKFIRRSIEREDLRREKNRETIRQISSADPSLGSHPVIQRWAAESKPIPKPWPQEGERIEVRRVAADPAHVNQRIEFRKSADATRVLGDQFRWDAEDLYGYDRAYERDPDRMYKTVTILDPTAGGGSIPFEALRLGASVVANELNPVASTVLFATLRYPVYFGNELSDDIEKWGSALVRTSAEIMEDVYPHRGPLPADERKMVERHLKNCQWMVPEFDSEETVDYLYCRQVTCPHCEGEAPLLNTCWLSKDDDKWGVRIVPDGKPRGGKVRFETYRVVGGRGPNGEDPDFATVDNGVGLCIHCRQAIPAEEIKAQARGESRYGKWKDRLYCVVAIRLQPKLDERGQPRRYRSGEIMTEKVRFFRPPNERDLKALAEAERRLMERWPEWERQGLIPTERIPEGHKTVEPLRFGMTRWCDMFTPRQLLSHLIMVEELNRLKPKILQELGYDRGRAVVTYLQFVIDKCLDYNSKQTLWHAPRAVIAHTFARHDFSLKWTFGEMVFAGPNSGAAWALSQVVDAYRAIAELIEPLHKSLGGKEPPLKILSGTAAHLHVPDRSVDLICMDPPYYNNVQYAELSDYFYVWQRRTLGEVYPDLYRRRLTDKTSEAVANPARAGSDAAAASEYERMMREIFIECRRVLKDDGIMTVMFNHKSQRAWEALTRSLIEGGWIITACAPIESEPQKDIHHNEMAAPVSSVFLSCRKRISRSDAPAIWSGYGGTGVMHEVRAAVREGLKEMEHLRLNAVDEMVASYGRALKVLSENWPVVDGDEEVGPIRAMNEAASVVAQYQVARATGGRLRVDDLTAEGAMALIAFSVFGLREFPFDEALNIARSLNMKLETKMGGYTAGDRTVGVNQEARSLQRSRRATTDKDEDGFGYHAPFVIRGSKMRLVLPEERNKRRIESPQTEWDVLHGLIRSYREGDIPVARDYLEKRAGGRTKVVIDLLRVWADRAEDEKIAREARAILFGLG